MEEKDIEETKIVIGENKIITRGKLFKDKANFHREQARLPFEEKIRILIKLQEIANRVKGSDRIIWEI